MSFSFGVGDFLAVSQLVLRLYNACDGAPEEFTQRKADLSFLAYPALYCSLQPPTQDPTSLLQRSHWVNFQTTSKH
jgi:hypothetical protein